MFTRYVNSGFVYTMHHVHEQHLSDLYNFFPDVEYVTISDFQRQFESMPRVRTIHHGIDLNVYQLREKKQNYVAFLGRIAPIKGTHLAIDVAKKAGIPLKIAGEVQPIFQEYFDTMIKPHLDGKFIEFVGEADLAAKNEVLGNAAAMLFPIQWNEPFGLVMIEAMACGTPVLAFSGGAVEEVVRDGVSGFICKDVDDMANRAKTSIATLKPRMIRQYCQQHFSVDRMVADYLALYTELVGESSPVGKTSSIIPLIA
jgi:glycosyltransferase involved in cell wall biosynthesis